MRASMHPSAHKRKARSAIEHVFAHQKGLRNLTSRAIGLARARVKIGLANIAYNMRRFIWLRTKEVLRECPVHTADESAGRGRSHLSEPSVSPRTDCRV